MCREIELVICNKAHVIRAVQLKFTWGGWCNCKKKTHQYKRKGWQPPSLTYYRFFRYPLPPEKIKYKKMINLLKNTCSTKFWDIIASKSSNSQLYWIVEMKFHPYQHTSNSIYQTCPFQHKKICFTSHSEKNKTMAFPSLYRWNNPNAVHHNLFWKFVSYKYTFWSFISNWNMLH